MKASVIRAYTDRITGEIHLEGNIVELTNARAEELAAGGFVVVTSKATTQKEPAAEAASDEPKATARKRTPRKASK